MGRVLCIANQKGGVGKTTTAANLAVGLAKSGYRTLLADLDPQCNATSALGQKSTPRHAFVSQAPIRESLIETSTHGLALLPGSQSFRDVETLATASQTDAAALRQQLTSGLSSYDFVLFDCPPSLGQLTRIALSSSTEVVIPIQCEYFAMEGLTQMIEVIRQVMAERPERLEFGGIVLTMYEHSLELSREVDHEVREFFGEIVYETVIPRDVSVSEAPSHGQAVFDYDPRGRGARAYVELCMEVLEHE